ncbi:MBL fold metallo-hydrolase [Dactylosporangium sp. AC04546]|uniref:pyrroloquinoline quinone biosynthesis protein PqqB n=1 Tax=Dactylosporangium sp. AC04546 TaxID=2862460 RepID=UPI001EDD3975|nr:MBL fold metallo-hydrolase [Dactylosporangium sp. AC04546]WVK79137.1 MBL fold metallo-hydrolase [Dactylosporangium sp. AC04546]
MRVRILGSAAGGGIPQWNCACAGCAAARRSGAHRTQDGVAVTGDGTAWYLVNASPDLRVQLVSAGDLDPGPGRRDTPIRGVLLTTAELDHTAGLLGLREAGRLDLTATATVLAALPLIPILRRYTDLRTHELPIGAPLALDGGLTVRALVVGAKVPRYADPCPDHRPDDAWVTALRIGDERTGRSFVYATCLPAWTDAFDAFLAGADAALLDGTFSTEDEPARAAGLTRTPREMGHLPIAGALPALRRHPGVRFLFGHLNNTNPYAAGPAPVEVARDGQELLL